MDQLLAKTIAARDAAGTMAILRRELIAGATLALVTLPVCMAAGLLVYGQLGQSFLTEGVLSGIYGPFLPASLPRWSPVPPLSRRVPSRASSSFRRLWSAI
jgi:hypothetical protein